MKKFKTYGFWTALSGAVVIFLNALGDCFGFSVDNELVSALIMAFAGVLVVLGVVSMPGDNSSEVETGEEQEENLSDTQDNNENNKEENIDNAEDEENSSD